MKNFLHAMARDMLAPIGRRVGSIVGAGLAGYDFAPDQVVQLESAAVLAAGMIVDLALAKAFRVEIESKPKAKPRVRKAKALIDLPDDKGV